MASNNGKKMYTVDKFLGLNESVDGFTELKMGEASRMENWMVTDGYNITTRPGIQKLQLEGNRDEATILAAWAGHIGKKEYLVICDFADGKDRLWVYGKDEDDNHVLVSSQSGTLGLTAAKDSCVKIFYFNKLYVMSAANTVTYEGSTFQKEEPYIPLVITGANPAGAGTIFENINLLTGKRRIEYSADGSAKDYFLPDEAVSVVSAKVDNVTATGTFSASNKKFTFNTAPAKGVANVEIVYDTDSETAKQERTLSGRP